MKFKEFLRESSGNYPVIVLWGSVGRDYIDQNTFNELVSYFKKSLAKFSGASLINAESTSVSDFDIFVQAATPAALQLADELDSAVYDAMTDVNRPFEITNGISSINVTWPPAFKLERLDIMQVRITLTEGANLSNLEELLPSCGELVLDGCEYLNGVLSLLKYDVPSIEFNANSNRDEIQQVAEIFLRHFHGDRDALQCQEDLIEAGLERYAEL